MTPQPWEEEFKKLMKPSKETAEVIGEGRLTDYLKLDDKLKSFIRTLIDQAREEERIRLRQFIIEDVPHQYQERLLKETNSLGKEPKISDCCGAEIGSRSDGKTTERICWKCNKPV